MNQYRNESDIQAVVRGFETCQTAGDAFTHGEHLTVALWYLREGDEAAALTRMREGLLRFLAEKGEDTGKYNETITLFWLKLIGQFLERNEEHHTLLEKVNAVVNTLNNSRLVFDYYSEELLRSEAAKKNWVPPDLKPLE
jgi:hypothetical protein